jgi:hypothetical protein
MLSVKTRRFAVPVVVACVGVLGSSATAHAAGGLSITPAVLEHSAKVGTVGTMSLNNSTNETLRVTVTVRPWRQELNGTVIGDLRNTLSKYIRATTQTFSIRAGAKRALTLKLYHVPHGGSLYGGVDIFGKPTHTKGRKGIIPQYRIISKVRLNASHKSYNWRTGAAQIRQRAIILPVRNLGNSIDPIGGSYRITGPSGRSGTMKAIAALPGKLIGLNLGYTNGLKKGTYTINATVTQGNRRAVARTSFTIR